MTTLGRNNACLPLDFENFSNAVNGKLVTTKETRHGINPSTLSPLPEVPLSTKEDVDYAVQCAKLAFKGWSQTPILKRREAVINYANALSEQKQEFATLLVREQGKPMAVALDEIERGVRWLTVQAQLPLDDKLIEETDDRLVLTRYMPLGVAAAIVPWNYPVMLACGKIAPALVTGNVLIMKPSPFTPYCGLKLAELAQRFFPPGVFQALSGGDDLGPLLTEHPAIDKISFTGSTATGKRVMESCSRTLKRVTLELGGNDPAIVCADVDIRETVAKIAQLALMNSGQVCIAIKRVYVHSSIYDDFLKELVEFTKTLTVGDGLGDAHLGPVQNSLQYQRVKHLLEDIRAENLDVVTGPASLDLDAANRKGYFINPVIVSNPPDTSRVVTDEPFAPVFPILKWDTEEDVVRRANGTDMGLGASVWSRDLKKAAQIARLLEAGSVWVNNHAGVEPNAAFAGHKCSGIGAEWGVEGLRAFCNPQTLFLQK
ncbi:aldehyde dehydrogenase [Thelonectria olida]|uniref:aldehyde dehydrogenase (NAD(+)) n=1 Tax=Thelonectria olida TaxID=1576542 RepID=A0A9P8VQE3_9HYPO|nr:aldehyde dehydrogenase [Thelonectria olida]